MPARFEWTPELRVGVKAIDEQHQILLEDTRRLFEAWDRGDPREDITKIIHRLSDFLQVHFDTEEQYIKSILDDYDNFAHHLEEHTQFLTKSIDFLLKYHQGQEDLSKEMLEDMLEWWGRHIKVEDMELGERLHALGYA
jgi:hemerythrin